MKTINAQEVLNYIQENNYKYEVKGNWNIEVNGFSSLSSYKPHTITWINKISNSIPSGIELAIVETGLEVDVCAQIIVDNSKACFFDIIGYFWGEEPKVNSIGNGTYIGDNVSIAENVIIGNNCSIDGDIIIGANTVISDNVVIKNRVSIGKNCNIQSLVSIGEDGFGYYEKDGKKIMINHHGGVLIGDDVFIGSHTNIARATIDDTIIESGTKISPSCHIGHNGFVGNDTTVICSQLYGSVCIDNNAYIVGSIVKNKSHIGQNTMIGMGSVVVKDIGENKIAYGIPAMVKRDNR